MSSDDAGECARVHTESTADGVHSHGINRVVPFIEQIHAGHVRLGSSPELVRRFGAVEVWDGNRAPGVLNALHATDRAGQLAAENGIGLVGLRDTNHWMRGGTYGWRAADRGHVLVAWTNTDPNMPAWGAKDRRLGNNPFVMAAPRRDGAMVLDIAMSQYSYGALEASRRRGEPLPFAGGFDEDGVLTDDPGLIESSHRILPMGMWKGSAFAILLDVLSAVLSDGRHSGDVAAIGAGGGVGCSQVFIAIDPRRTSADGAADGIADRVVEYVRASVPDEHGRGPDYPGAGTLRRRAQSQLEGVEVDDSVWAGVRRLAASPS